MKKITLTLVFLFMHSSVIGQEVHNGNNDTSNNSLVIGTLNMDFIYADTQFEFDHTYNGNKVSFLLGSTKSYLHGSYGTQDLDPFGEGSSLTNLRVDAQIGGDNIIFEKFIGLPLALHVPVRFNLGYQYLSYDLDESNPVNIDVTDFENDLNFINANLGAGAGATMRLPLALIGSQLKIDAVYVRSLGAMFRLIEDEDAEIGLSTINDFMIQARIKEFLGGRIGVSAGYKRRTLEWSSEDPGGFTDILGSIISSDSNMINSMNSNMFFIGISW